MELISGVREAKRRNKFGDIDNILEGQDAEIVWTKFNCYNIFQWIVIITDGNRYTKSCQCFDFIGWNLKMVELTTR